MNQIIDEYYSGYLIDINIKKVLDYIKLNKIQNKFETLYVDYCVNEDNIKYHVSKSIYSNIFDALNGKNTDNDVKLRDCTPKILVDNGVHNLPMLANVSHLKENILTSLEARQKGLSTAKGKHYHGLGLDTYIKAIENLDNPIAIYQWQKNDKNKYNSKNYVILTAVRDNNNLRVIVPITIDSKGNYNNIEIDTNKINTIYGKGDIKNYFQNNINDGSMKLIYKKSRTNNLHSVTDSALTKNNIS